MALDKGEGGFSYPPVLRTLAADHREQWRESAHTEVTRVRSSLTATSTFGDAAPARAYAQVYEAAALAYEETLRGIREDLVEAGAALAAAAGAMRERDDLAADTFAAIAPRWSAGEGFHSDRRHARAEQGDEMREGAAERDALTDDARGDA
ncbi:hypothetical protein KC207_05940 [Phycicoccus sp. BSK3Z-2]|uniref:Uncharacterized protein n=1 Tax=Phycicoccus avicenniae TaxID=2828860 RepID=A0A941D993_9MICO|nr:hypothetical protein [Phycicoccus avicenniae]MBR7742832.1 hypothetical protein [Phycicoccus avicenniae]